MAKLLVISLLILTGCFGRKSPKVYEPMFSVGDCIELRKQVESKPEKWENQKGVGFVQKILEIGNRKYRTLTLDRETETVFKSDSSYFYDDVMVKVECPSELGAFYE